MSQNRGASTRTRIIDAAIELFSRHGRESVSVQDICAASGATNGSLFHHFGSKNGVALVVYLQLREDYWDAALTALEAWSGDPVEAIGEAARAVLAWQEDRPDEFKFMIECGNAEWMLAHGEPVRKLNEDIAARWLKWAQPHLASGALPLLPPEVYPAIVFGPAQWLARSWQTGLTPTSPREYADTIVPMLVKAFRPQ